MHKYSLLGFILILSISIQAQEKITLKGNLKTLIPVIANNMNSNFSKLVNPVKDSIEKLTITLEHEPTIKSINVVWNTRFNKVNRVITITWKPTQQASVAIKQQQEIVFLLVGALLDVDKDFTENRLVNYVRNGEPVAAYDATFTSKANDKCYVSSVVNSDYSNRAKPFFHNEVTFYSCN